MLTFVGIKFLSPFRTARLLGLIAVGTSALFYSKTSFAEYRTTFKYSLGTSMSPEDKEYAPTSNKKFVLSAASCSENLFFCLGFGYGQGTILGATETTETVNGEEIVTSTSHFIRYQLITIETKFYPLNHARQYGYLFLDPYFTLNGSLNRYTSKLSNADDGESQVWYSHQQFSAEYGIGFDWQITKNFSTQFEFSATDESYLVNGESRRIMNKFVSLAFSWCGKRSQSYRP